MQVCIVLICLWLGIHGSTVSRNSVCGYRNRYGRCCFPQGSQILAREKLRIKMGLQKFINTYDAFVYMYVYVCVYMCVLCVCVCTCV